MTEYNNLYKRRLWSGASLVLGLYLIIEHLVSWGDINFWDICGHEQFGLLFVLIGVFGLFNYNYPKWLQEKNKKKFKLN